MKITITYGTSYQTGTDTWDSYTEVIHLKETSTLQEVYDAHFKKNWKGNVNVQIHFNPEAESGEVE